VVQRLKDFVADLPSRVVSSFSEILGVAGKVTSAVFNIVTVAILMLYLLLSLPSLKKTSAMMVSKDWRERTVQVADQAVAKIGGFVSGNVLTSLICALVTLIALALFRVPYAIPLALWAGVADLIPAVGSYLGAIPAVAIALFQSPLKAILVIAYFIAYQQFENFYLVPKVMRNAVDLSPATVIIATLIGSSLSGFAGALLALPAAATIKVVLYDVWLHARSEEGDVVVPEHIQAEVHAEEAAEEKAAPSR
jgi:predicted PurR-regulated permease PerM